MNRLRLYLKRHRLKRAFETVALAVRENDHYHHKWYSEIYTAIDSSARCKLKHPDSAYLARRVMSRIFNLRYDR